MQTNITLKRIKSNNNFEFFKADYLIPAPKEDESQNIVLPLFDTPVSAGFPSPADDYVDIYLDLNKQLIEHPNATFYVRVKGSSMKNSQISHGDLLIVDRSLEPQNNDIVLGVLNGEFTVKKLIINKGNVFLMPENENYHPIKITEEMDFQVWGVVSYVIHDAKNRKTKL